MTLEFSRPQGGDTVGQKQMLLRAGFTKGVKPSLDPSIVPPDALWKGQNLRPNKAGILRIRTGCRKVARTPNLVGDLWDTLPGIQGLVATDDKLFAMREGLFHCIDIEQGETLIMTGKGTRSNLYNVSLIPVSSGGKLRIISFTGDGVMEILPEKVSTDERSTRVLEPYNPSTEEKPNLYTDNDSDCIQNSPIALLRPSISQRMVVTGNPDAPNEVYFSAPMQYNYFPSDQVLKLPDDGGEVVGLAVWYNALLIFRDKDIYAFFGTDMNDPEAQLVLQNNATGCINGKTIQRIPEYGIIFLGNDNVYLISGVTGLENQLALKPIGDDVADTIQNALKSGGHGGICSTYHNNTYILTIPESRVSTFKWRDGAWYIDTGPYVSCYTKCNGRLYGGSFFSGEVYEFNENDLVDADDDYRMKVITRRHLFVPTSARISRLYLYLLSGSVLQNVDSYYFGDLLNTLMYNEASYKTTSIERGSDQHLKVSLMVDGKKYTMDTFNILIPPMETETLEVDMPLQIYEARFNPVIKGHSVQLKIETTNPGEDIAILGYGLEYFTRKSLDDKSKSRKAISFIGGSNVK